MSLLSTLVEFLRSQDVFEIYLPFLLTFSIFYGAIRKMNIFGRVIGEDKKPGSDRVANNISVIVALVAAIYVTIYTPVGITISQFFSRFFAISSIWMIGIITFMMMFGLFLFLNPADMLSQFQSKMKIIAIFTVALVALTWLLSGGLSLFVNLPSIGLPGISTDDILVIVLLLGTVGLIAFATTGERSGDDKKKTTTTTTSGGG